MTKESMEYDVVIVGGGPSGLTTAIKLKQLNSNLNVCVLEKASEIGAHILSGNVFETRALDELIPNWRELNSPIKTKVTKEKFLFLGKNKSLNWPTWLLPTVQKNHNNYIISLDRSFKDLNRIGARNINNLTIVWYINFRFWTASFFIIF